MGRRRKGRSVEVKLLIPEFTYLQFERELTLNFKTKPEYGVRSQVITRLIQDWLATREAERNQATEPNEQPLPTPQMEQSNGPDEPEHQRSANDPAVV